MALQALRDGTWGNVDASIITGTMRAPFTKLQPGKLEIKTDKVRRVGEAVARKRTVGGGEISDTMGEMLASDYEESILPRMPKHGGTLVEFNLYIRAQHPAISGFLALWYSETRIISEEGPEIDASAPEKGLIYKLGFSSMGRFVKGRDGIWKCTYYDPRRPSADAIPAIPF